SRTFFHGHSYTGNPIAAAAAVASLEIFAAEPVFERIKAITGVHQQRLAPLEKHPAVGETRSIRTVAAIELKAGDPGYFSGLLPHLYKFFLERGVLLRPLGNVIYILPPYVITADQLNLVYDVVTDALDLVSNLTAGLQTAGAQSQN